jgi:hypothetical protein
MKLNFPWMDPDITKMMATLNMPPMDLEGLAESQRKNMEAMNQLCMLAIETIQESARRQSSLVAGAVEQMFASARALSANGSGAPQADAQRELIEKGVANLRELAELIAKSNTEAFGIISQRAAGALDEMKAMGQGKTGGK